MYFIMNRAKMPELGNAWEGCIDSSVVVMWSYSSVFTLSIILVVADVYRGV